MAKKVRKPRSASPRTYGQAGPQPADAVPPAKPVAAPSPAPRPVPAAMTAEIPHRSGKKVDLRAEYPFVGKDLRRLGITAAAMFTVLVVLNLVLNFVR